MLVEQAIFTSARTQQAEGYHLVARSSGVSDSDARELTIWCPSHDALVDSSKADSSLNFFRLDSGRYCISRSAAVGAEYSGRHGPRIETYCLMVDAEILSRFANNPKALFEAATAGGKLCQVDPPPRHLTPFALPGRKHAFDSELVSRLVDRFGLASWTVLLEAMVTSRSLGLVALNEETEENQTTLGSVMTGLLNCLPVSCRAEISFSSGLKHSARRPFRWLAVDADPVSQRQMARQHGVPVFDLNQPNPWPRSTTPSGTHNWVTFISECLRQGDFEFLEEALGQSAAGVSIAELPRLGNQYLGELARSPTGGSDNTTSDLEEIPDNTEFKNSAEETPETSATPNSSGPNQSPDIRAHQAHRRRGAQVQEKEPRVAPAGPADQLQNQWPKLSQGFFALDKALQELIESGASSAEVVSSLWSDLRKKIDSSSIEQVRLQYLNHVIAIWNQLLTCSESTPASSSRALDALCLFTDASFDNPTSDS